MHPNKIPDLVDSFISRKYSPNFIEVEGKFDLDSNHLVIILTLNETVIQLLTWKALKLNF